MVNVSFPSNTFVYLRLQRVQYHYTIEIPCRQWENLTKNQKYSPFPYTYLSFSPSLKSTPQKIPPHFSKQHHKLTSFT